MSHLSPGDGIPPVVRWAYWDYRHLAHLLPPHLLAAFPWAPLGLPGRDGGESTLWVGTRGAHTPCHQVGADSHLPPATFHLSPVTCHHFFIFK